MKKRGTYPFSMPFWQCFHPKVYNVQNKQTSKQANKKTSKQAKRRDDEDEYRGCDALFVHRIHKMSHNKIAELSKPITLRHKVQ
jgi:hypothetical protein